MIIYWDSLEKNATDPALIPDYIASGYFMRGLNIAPVTFDGWFEAKEIWTYNAPNKINVPAGALAKYAVGDRIKWTQTTVKYGAIIAVADELLTIAVNTDYVVADAAISANYYSHEVSPVGFPGWFECAAPTFATSLFDNGAGGQPTVSECRYSITGRICTVHLRATGYKAGTNNNLISFPSSDLPPISAANYTSKTGVGPIYIMSDTTTFVAGIIRYEDNGYFSSKMVANIADNIIINDASFTISYEI